MTDTDLQAIWREECDRAPGWLSIPLKAKGLRFDEAALMRIGEAIEAVAGVPARPQAARPEDAAAGDQLPMAPECSPCAANEDGRCCGTGECWTCPLSAEKFHDFQARTAVWMRACFGAEISLDRTERSHRFIEEALELVQAAGCTSSEAHQLVDYVFGRPVGELPQEVGGVMVTLAALCQAHDVDMHAAGETELGRVWTKIDVIRAKHAMKPKHSPLPGQGNQITEAEQIATRSFARESILTAFNAASATLDGDDWVKAGRMLTAALTAIDAAIEAALAAAAGQPAERAQAEPMRLLATQPAPARDVVPGKVHCAKCGFTLQRVNLYMLSGTTGAGGEETEPCPNDGTPLLPITWEQEAREAMTMAEQQFDRAHALEEAAAELLACKDLKDEESRLRQRRDVAISRNREATATVDAMRDDYNRRKPLAWAAMRALLPKVVSHG